MAVWTTIADENLDPGEPLTNEEALALRDNPIAIAEGAASAPRIFLGSLERLEAGDETRISETTEERDGGTAVRISFGVIQYGDLRFSGQHKAATGGVSVLRIQRTRNGTVSNIASWTNSSESTFQTRTLDFSVLPGDFYQVISEPQSSGSSDSRNLFIRTNGQDLWPCGPGHVTGNRTPT